MALDIYISCFSIFSSYFGEVSVPPCATKYSVSYDHSLLKANTVLRYPIYDGERDLSPFCEDCVDRFSDSRYPLHDACRYCYIHDSNSHPDLNFIASLEQFSACNHGNEVYSFHNATHHICRTSYTLLPGIVRYNWCRCDLRAFDIPRIEHSWLHDLIHFVSNSFNKRFSGFERFVLGWVSKLVQLVYEEVCALIRTVLMCEFIETLVQQGFLDYCIILSLMYLKFHSRFLLVVVSVPWCLWKLNLFL